MYGPMRWRVCHAVVSYRQTADDHVRVTDRLNLVDVVVLNDGVKQRVQVVQQLHDLTAQRHQANGFNTNTCISRVC